MRITRAEAEAYFAHKSQRKAAMLNGPLPDGLQYYADAGVCLATHGGMWPGLVMVHIGAKPEAWGCVDSIGTRLLHEIWDTEKPDRITAWFKESNRAVRALCLRIGMTFDGRLDLPEPVLIYGWRA